MGHINKDCLIFSDYGLHTVVHTVIDPVKYHMISIVYLSSYSLSLSGQISSALR